MPDFDSCSDSPEEIYEQFKHLRSSSTSKRLRHLRVFERIYYKKTCEVKKSGHNLDDAHRLDDGNLRYATRNLTYSLNKKKRWLLPKIIEERIREHDSSPGLKEENQISNLDKNLKIVMYENENVHYPSTCIRYGNSQTEPRILHRNGRRFNSNSLMKWMDFNTRFGWNQRRRNENNDNEPNFGFQQRAGFFPSEVTYEFLYPKRVPKEGNHKGGRTSLRYKESNELHYNYGRHRKDTTKNRRRVRKSECIQSDKDLKNDDLFEDAEENEIYFDDELTIPGELSIGCFIPVIVGESPVKESVRNISIKRNFAEKSHIHILPVESQSTPSKKASPQSCEKSLTSILCSSEAEFVKTMKQTGKYLSQANVSPSIFIQTTASSPFSIIYSYSRSSSTVEVRWKFVETFSNFFSIPNSNDLQQLIDFIFSKLNEQQIPSKVSSTNRIFQQKADDLRGSIVLPNSVMNNLLLVQPNSIEKQVALTKENSVQMNESSSSQWFELPDEDYAMFECSICCDTLSSTDVFRLLPCCHTLCHPCLNSFIRTSISTATYSSSRTSPLTCFENNCSTVLNSTLLQSFVSIEIYRNYSQSILDRHLFSSGTYRQCPSRICSNLLIVMDPSRPSLMCSCGQRVCSKCLEEYHFPATCEQYKHYFTRLRQSGDDVLSTMKIQEKSHSYIAEGKNCPNCGEFVEKNGGCPHMTCKCGNEYCWMCLRRWATHDYATCFTIPESTHELRSSVRNRLYNRAVNHRRERNQYSFNSLSSVVRQSKRFSVHYDILLSTYIDLNTLAEYLYVFLQRRKTDVNIRAVLSRTARRLENDAFRMKIQIQSGDIHMDQVKQIRSRFSQTVANLIHMKKNQTLI